MRGFFRSLYGKLFAVFLALLLGVGATYTYLTLFSSEMYFAETSQRINSTLARHIVDEIQPFLVTGRLNVSAMDAIFHDVMVVNPSVEVYLLDPKGTILAFDAPKEKVKLTSVDLRPIQEFLDSGGKSLVLGDNPRDAKTRKVFSAAPVNVNGRVNGYIYVILRGEEFDSIADRIFSSHILTLGMRGLLLSFLGATVVGLIALAMVTTKLRRLTRTALSFKEGDYSQRINVRGNDELDQLGQAFNSMADALAGHVEELRHIDELRRELIANVSHDLRTPLASMQGYLETVLMKDAVLEPHRRREYLEVIFSSTERLSRLIQDLFELSKLEAKQTQPHLEPFSLAELVNDLVQKSLPVAEKKQVSIHTQFAESLPPVNADIGMIERVLQNLVDNAMAYTQPGGRVDIVLSQCNDEVRVRVQDTGVGISEGDIPFIFDRYYQSRTRGKPGGAGLGLAIVKKILDAHGVSISVQSRVGEGTRFTFSLSRDTPQGNTAA